MSLAFTRLEARVNAAVIARLANRTATVVPVGGGAPRNVDGLYDAEYATQLDDMVGGSTPAFICASAQAADLTKGATVVLTSVLEILPDGTEVVWASATFTVAEHMPDGAGLTVLRLRKAT